MKALLTAGGRGTRLRPITHTQNKHLIPIANKPILFYALENIRDAGITDVGIIIAPENAYEVEQAVKREGSFGMKITYIPQGAPLGLAHCVKIAEEFIGKEPFVFYLGDNMIVGGIKRFVDRFYSTGVNCFLTLARVAHPERFGVPEFDGEKIVRITEKPAKPSSPFAVAGIYIYDNHIFEAVNALKPSARGELEISDAHQYLIEHGFTLGYDEITGWWKDTGTPDDLLEANRFVLEHAAPVSFADTHTDCSITGNVIVGEGAVLRRCKISGPVIIGAHCTIEDADIRPFTSIGNDSHISRATIENSIVLDRCSINDVPVSITGSIIGFDTEIIRGKQEPPVHRFMIGDQSRLEIV
ncbi:MAG TPA: glucose-1-phosphate thymidylyltransferase [Candidatus Kapabacteria bacterium]|nr:glucose-1-phosphate thymidylyltransferase [Candidatus Kapabacteria bacterium]